MKNLLPALFLLLTASPMLSQETKTENFIQKKEARLLNKEFPAFKVDSLSNRNLLGHVTVINFWFQACGPCIAEMDGLNDLYDSNKADKNFRFLSFCTDDPETIAKNVKKFGIEYPVLAISKEKAYELNFDSGFPTTFILNAKGEIIHFSLGGFLDKAKATEFIMTVYDPKVQEELGKV